MRVRAATYSVGNGKVIALRIVLSLKNDRFVLWL